MPLLDPDEPVYAETPKEMLLFNNFISPQIYGEYWYDKPPMYYWLVAGAFKLFGINEFAARFPSALLAVICVIVVYMSVAKLISERAGIASGLVLATSIEYFYLGKAAVTDITLTLFLTTSLLCFLQKKYYLCYLFSALATLTKGPIGFLFPGAIVLIWMAFTQRLNDLKHMKIPLGIISWMIVVLPWYGVMYQLHGSDFINGFIGVNNITRFTTAEHAQTSEWYFFIPVLIFGFFPWTALMYQSIKGSFKTKRIEKQHGLLLFFNVWAAFIFLFFSISSTKLVTYILPAYPPLAILVGWYLDQCMEKYRFLGEGLIWPAVLTLLSVIFIGGLVVEINLIPEIMLGAVLLAIVLVLMMLTVWYFLYHKAVKWAFWGQAIAMMITSIIVVTVLLPPIEDNFSTRSIAKTFVANYDGKSPVYVSKFLHPGFSFYTDTYGEKINSTEEIRNIIFGEDQAYLVIRSSEYQGLSASEQNILVVLFQSNDKLLLLKQ
jgi:4-amino-4-deoxy-L-arabinose transferase-like glycosyltransferase